jgi:hypothetical protein
MRWPSSVSCACGRSRAELSLELPNGAGERRLGDVALLRSAREVERTRDRKEVADLM